MFRVKQRNVHCDSATLKPILELVLTIDLEAMHEQEKSLKEDFYEDVGKKLCDELEKSAIQDFDLKG